MCDAPPCILKSSEPSFTESQDINEGEGEEEKDCEDIPYMCVRDCSKYAPCFVVEYCMSVSNEPGVCETLSNSLYEIYHDNCRYIPRECEVSCKQFYHCFQCHELCENSCVFGSDNECDDGGFDSIYSACSDGTDCEDCGYRLSTDCSFTGKAFVQDPAKPPFLPPSQPGISAKTHPPSQPISSIKAHPPSQPINSAKPHLPSRPVYSAKPHPPSQPMYPAFPPNSRNISIQPTHMLPNYPPLIKPPSLPSPFHPVPQFPLQISRMETNPIIGISILSCIFVFSTFISSYMYYKRRNIRAIIHITNPLANQEIGNAL